MEGADLDEAVGVVAADGKIGGKLGGARIARCAVEVSGGKIVAKGPAERVLAATPADDQNLHFCRALRKASRAEAAAFLAASVTLSIVSRASPA